ncbi:hypothetical protein NDGK_00211 [Clostridiales bacterium CHKCI001]|nr:hypothetical protein NDGK_00211 [Clostridiales bacterium CHKCI001]
MEINTDALKASAQIMEGKNTQYSQEWNRLYTEKDSLMQTDFKSEASMEFSRKLDAYKNSFESLGKVIDKYVKLINTIAQRHEDINETSKNRASGLPTGN